MNISRQRMGQAALLIIAGTILSNIFGLIRETIIAYQFGATAQTDAYLVASVIPMALSGMVAGAVAVAFIPVFTEYRLKAGEGEAWTIASAVITLAALFLVAGAVLYLLAAPFLVPLLGPGLAPETKALAVHLSRLLVPAIIFTGLVGLATAVLNAYRHFTFPAFAGLLNNFGIIGGALLLGGLMGISGLVVGAVAGAAAHLLALSVPLAGKKTYYRPTLKGLRHPGVKKIGLLLLPFIVGSAAGQINLLVDRVLASGLVEGSISALNFAVRVMQLPLGIFAGAAATAAYPFLAEQAAAENADDLRRTFSEGLRVLWFIVFPLSVGLMVLGQPIIRLLFERGAFDAAATQMTAVALLYYSLGIFAHAANVLLVRVYFALQDTATPTKLGLLAVGLNIVLNLILVRYLAHGGLALASSIAAAVNCLLLAYYLRRRLGNLDGRRILRSTVKFAAASLAMGLAVAAAYSYTASFFDTALLTHRLLQVSGLIALGGAVYLGAAALLRTEELARIIMQAGARLLPGDVGGIEGWK
ncbi:MAG: murein biosynthesis integral membrane protein MurJ [Clostridia bacterium]|nr:murein biosynthesis integral membrane protein MurJ [Clostridia bacterium]